MVQGAQGYSGLVDPMTMPEGTVDTTPIWGKSVDQYGLTDPLIEKARQARQTLVPPSSQRDWMDVLNTNQQGAPQPGGPAVPTKPVGDYGLGGIQQRIAGRENAVFDPAITEGIDSAYQARQKSADEFGVETGRIEGQLQALATTQANINNVQQQALNASETRMQEAAKLAQYPSLSAQDIDKQQSIIDDTSGSYTPEQKRAAQLTLQRASTVDPTRLLSSSTGNKVLAVVAQALGTLGSGMTHGRMPNYGMELVKDAIDRDIMAQKSAFDQADRGYQRQRNVFSDLRAKFDSETQAINAHRSLLLSAAAQMADKYKAKDLAQQLNIESMKYRGEVSKEEEAHRLDALSKEAVIAHERQAGALENKKLDIVVGKTAGNAWAPMGVHFLPGRTPPPKGPLLNKFTDAVQNYSSIKPLLDDLISARGKYGAEILNRYGVTDMRALHAMLFDQLRKFVKTGAHLSPDERKNIEAMISADPSAVGLIGTRLAATKRALESAVNGELHAYGAELDDTEPSLEMGAATPAGR